MTFMAAARTSVQRAAFDIVCIVPSTSMTWTTSSYDDDHRERHMSDAPRSQSQLAAECSQKRDVWIWPTWGSHPEGENGVGDFKRSASIMSGGLVIQSPPTWTNTAMTSAPPIQ